VLVYLASYPRSGNTWVRHLVGHHFGYNSASLYPEPQGAPNLEYREDGTFELFSYFEVLRRPGVIRPMLVNACGPVLSPELRQQLAQSEDCFFLKTHELPYGSYCSGEYVLYLVRTPGAVFWSYYRYLRKNEPTYAQVTLDDVICGQVPFGSWSDHIDAWFAARSLLGEHFLLCSYEELSQNEWRVRDLLGSCTGLPDVTPPHPLARLEHWHQIAPHLYRKEDQSLWKPYFSASQLRHLRRLHGKTMQRLGYDIREYHRSLLEQLRHTIALQHIDGVSGKQ
jgi:Sulfotransferase domain